MNFLHENMTFLESLTYGEKKDILLRHYSKIPDEIVEYTLLKHYSAVQMIEEFLDINLNNSKISLQQFSNEQLFETIDYAHFCTFCNESEEYFNSAMKQNLELEHIKEGSWGAPIVLVKRENSFLTLDGNNRLRMLRCYIRWSNIKCQNQHMAYVIDK